MSSDQDGCEWVSFLLVLAYPGSPGSMAVKWLCVCVFDYLLNMVIIWLLYILFNILLHFLP